MVLATTHSKQSTPTNGSEPPLIATGIENVIPQISSSRFVQKAKARGEIIDIDENKTISVQYSNGSIDHLDIIPRLSRTKINYSLIYQK